MTRQTIPAATAPPTAIASRFFDAIARRYDRVYGLDREASRRRMARVLEAVGPPCRVLDLGVGTGRELGALQDAGHQPTGFDASREMLRICARRSRPVPLVYGDFWKPLPFATASFEAIIALHGTLGHPPADDAWGGLLHEIARVLAPSGVFVAEVPTPSWLDAMGSADWSEESRLVRTGEGRCVHEDLATHERIEVRVLGEEGWRALLGGWDRVVVASHETGELLVVARRPQGPLRT